MLILPKPADISLEDWEKAELTAMQEIVGLYGKTWHFWHTDRGDELPLGQPVLMGSVTHRDQVNLDKALDERNRMYDVHHDQKAEKRKHIEPHNIHPSKFSAVF
ncbi:hypothetical protein MMC12_000891 [Toensbergia leucococca]|nr:hypothetical protein [Toensbergia leucococca]